MISRDDYQHMLGQKPTCFEHGAMALLVDFLAPGHDAIEFGWCCIRPNPDSVGNGVPEILDCHMEEAMGYVLGISGPLY